LRRARALHAALGFENPKQEVDFPIYRELLETLRMLGDLDTQALFEEFRGVIGARPSGPLSLADYLAPGTRQSLLTTEQRELAHGPFQRYRASLAEAGLQDSNLVAHEWRTQIAEGKTPIYDFVVIDEVQDLTPVQLALVLALLRTPGQFILCGDSHQLVHPNFFRWAALKNLFWQGLAGDAAQRQPLKLLQANFRNTRAVTQLSNELLTIKQARFGSVDRESNFLIRGTSAAAGEVRLLDAKEDRSEPSGRLARRG
jgi:superfamily I DNA/RNA helicase